MYGCRVDWSTEEVLPFSIWQRGETAQLKRCKPFEVSCLVARVASCFGGDGCGGRGTGIFVILLAVGSPGRAAVWGYEGSLPPFSHRPSTRGGTDICCCKQKAEKLCVCYVFQTNQDVCFNLEMCGRAKVCDSNRRRLLSGIQWVSKDAGEHSPVFSWFCLACLSASLLPESTGELHLGSVSVL